MSRSKKDDFKVDIIVGLIFLAIVFVISYVAYPHLANNPWRHAYVVQGVVVTIALQRLGIIGRSNNDLRNDRKNANDR